MQKNNHVKFQNPLNVEMVEIPLKNGRYLTKLRSFNATSSERENENLYECLSVEFSNDPEVSVGDQITSVWIKEWDGKEPPVGMRCVSIGVSPVSHTYSYSFVSVITFDGAYSEVNLILSSRQDIKVGDVYTFRYDIIKEGEVSAK